MRKILFFAFLFRLLIAPFFHHPDVYDQLNWAKNLDSKGYVGFYQRDVPDAGPPNYPPIYYLTIAANNHVYLFTKSILWYLNTKLTIFPSRFYVWYESDLGRIYFNKLLPIICDIGIGIVIYLLVKKFGSIQKAKNTILLYLFLPPSWYISSVWGQTDSVFILPLITSLYIAFSKKYSLFILPLILVSFLIKPIAIFLMPIIGILTFRLNKILIAIGGLLSFITFIVIHKIFGLSVAPSSLLDFYRYNIREISGYINNNSFNFWGIVHGFSPIPDSKYWIFIPAFYWGIFIFGVFALYYLLLFYKAKNPKIQILTIALFTFSGFLFLTRMHERYFYLSYILLIVSVILSFKKKVLIFLITFLFLVNLYHYWWVPGGDLFKYLLSNPIIEVLFCVTNIILFFYLERIREKINLYEKLN